MTSFSTVLSIILVLSLFGTGAVTLASAAPAEFGVKATGKEALPDMYMIEGIPWHEQLNALSCGAGSLETVFDYWGPDIEQKEIMNVARTSSSGTWTADIVRAGHFSYFSNAQGSYFPGIGPYCGFDERPLGYAAFSYSSKEFWINELKGLVAIDIPVIVLMNYYPWGGGGHYRVVIGYDDNQQRIYLSDPWGRDLNHLTAWTGVISWSYSDFQMGWNYSEYGTANPYFGVAIMPWHINISVKGRTTAGSVVTVTACINYPCPEPFDRAQFSAQNAVAQIVLPDGMTLLGSSATLSLGTVSSGSITTVAWKALCNTDATEKLCTVTAWGFVSGFVPDAQWKGQAVYYQAYNYTDAIGGGTTTSL